MTREFTTFGSLSDIIKDASELHHYTSFDGMKGIVESNSLWASHYTALNDSTEANMLRAALREPLAFWLAKFRLKRVKRLRLQKLKPNHRRTRIMPDDFEAADHILTQLQSKFIQPAESVDFGIGALSNPFILSFCNHSKDSDYEQENGLLSQWRGYAGDGCAIVFDTHHLLNLVLEEVDKYHYISVPISSVTYTDDKEELKDIANVLIQYIEELMGVRVQKDAHPLDRNVGYLALVALMVKHRGFREEREFRVVFNPSSVSQLAILPPENPERDMPTKPIRQRNIRGRMREYIAAFETLNKPLPIKRIIVGPSRDQSDAADRVRAIVGPNVHIKLSDTPYVG